MTNKRIYYDIYSEFYNINKFRELKCIVHHGTNRLEHINRVAKLSFYISKKLNLDYISCTRGAIMHDFFTVEDINSNTKKYLSYLRKHPNKALDNSINYFDVNEVEKDIILTHMFPVTKNKPSFRESKIVCLSDKLVSIYEFFRFQIKFSGNLLFLLTINMFR